MENFNADPKPGRLILPLVLIGMIATTYTFINRVTTNNNLEVINIEEDADEEIDALFAESQNLIAESILVELDDEEV